MTKVEVSHTDDEPSKRRKRRNIGTFPCSECSKVFTRSDHLARHYLNHQPKEVYVCDHIIKNHNGERRKCGKTFVRKDLRERHLKRHLMLQDSIRPEDDDEKPLPSTDSSLVGADVKAAVLPLMPLGSVNSGHTHSPSGALLAPNISGDMLRGSPRLVAPQESSQPSVQGIQQLQASIPAAPQVSLISNHQAIQSATQISHQVGNQVPGHITHSNSIPSHPGSHVGAHVGSLVGSNIGSNVTPLRAPIQSTMLANQTQGSHYSPPYQPLIPAMASNYPGQYIYSGMQNGTPQSKAYSDGQVSTSGLPQNLPNNHNVGDHGNNGGHHGIAPIMQPMGNIAVSPNMPHTSKVYMSSPPGFKQEPQMMNAKYAMNSNEMNRNYGFPQSQNDILLWLFMESPDMPKSAPRTGVPSHASSLTLDSDARAANLNHHQFTAPGQTFDNEKSFYEPEVGLLTPFYNNPPELNVGLQDLNFFLNNDNPLDEVFFRSQMDPNLHILRDKPIGTGINMYLSTASSSSPSNTNDSVTPKGLDLTLQSFELEPIKKRLEAHTRANRPTNKQFFLDSQILESLLQALPQITREQLNEIFDIENQKVRLEDMLSFYIYGYWEAFHTRFSILHKPSFDTSTCEPLLLLSMLLIGCMYCADSIEDAENHKMCPEYKFCMLVAVPLRFTIFQHKDFKSPVKVWILQSLNLLEWCEKNYLLRAMHERAHIHHGTTVQLLRRSPFLGGNPTVADKAVNSASDTGNSGGEEEQSDVGGSDIEETSNKDQILFHKWVDSESMKRVTFMTFYLDVIDYIKFRHNPQIPFFQLQLLNLPCDEEALWNAEDMGCSFKKIVKKQKKLQKGSGHGMRKLKEQNRIRPGMNFLSALKKMMRSQRVNNANQKLPMFTKSILFGGLVSIMQQMQQAELQNNFTLLISNERSDKQKNQVWKDILTKVFDTWEAEMHSQEVQLTRDPFFGIQRGQCKFPMYHLAQIVGMSDVNHYDIAIFGGSPGNQSVDATAKDMSIVQRKLTSVWSRGSKISTVNDLVNYKSVIHCYWLLWSLMLAPLGEDGNPINGPLTYGWRVDHDYYDAMYAVSIATLVLWCYTFTSNGTESETFKDLEATMLLKDIRDYEKIRVLAQEDSYTYLFRIRKEFTQLLQKEGLIEDYLLHITTARSTQIPLYTVIAKYCELLPRITNKQNISGLCFLVGTNLLKSQWQVIRENAKLIINCGLRSVGKRNLHCQDLFDNAFN